jgi:hypothetical protein
MSLFHELFHHTGFSKQEERSESELQTAFQESRKRHTITHQDRRLLDHEDHYLCAVNRSARVQWGKAVCREFEEFFDLDDKHPFPREPVFFVTLIHVACYTAHDVNFVNILGSSGSCGEDLLGFPTLGWLNLLSTSTLLRGLGGPTRKLSPGIYMRSVGGRAESKCGNAFDG